MKYVPSPRSAIRTRKLGKTGSGTRQSIYLTIPADIADELKWRPGQKVWVKKAIKSQHLIIQKEWGPGPIGRKRRPQAEERPK